MRIIRGLKHLSSLDVSPKVVTIGNFDGVHLGHQAILRQLRQKADARNSLATVILFEPQPLEFFQKTKAPARLTSLREKLILLKQYGVDMVVCLRFDQYLAALPANEFVHELLLKGLTTHHVIIGDDFRFGEGRAAGFDELVRLGQESGFEVEQQETCEYRGERISSSRLRRLLAGSDFTTAEKLLGRPYSISGRVRHGDKRGRELGFPTLNLAIDRLKPAIKGVFVSSVIRDNAPAEKLAAVSNIGIRPVFNGDDVLLETHILDFEQDLYGEYLNVVFHEKIRGEERFESIDDLKEQISLDIKKARRFFFEGH